MTLAHIVDCEIDIGSHQCLILRVMITSTKIMYHDFPSTIWWLMMCLDFSLNYLVIDNDVSWHFSSTIWWLMMMYHDSSLNHLVIDNVSWYCIHPYSEWWCMMTFFYQPYGNFWWCATAADFSLNHTVIDHHGDATDDDFSHKRMMIDNEWWVFPSTIMVIYNEWWFSLTYIVIDKEW